MAYDAECFCCICATILCDGERCRLPYVPENLSGQLTEETLEQVENEKRRLEQLQESSRESAEMSGTDEIDRLLMQLEWQRLHEGFQELTDQIRGLSEKEGKLSEKYLLDEKAYLDIWGNVTHEVLTWYVGAVLLLFYWEGFTEQERRAT